MDNAHGNTSNLHEKNDYSRFSMWECDTNPNHKGRIEAPTYESCFNGVLQEPGSEVSFKNNRPSKNNCFNCLGNHLIIDCPHPRDQRAITKNRREFMNKSSGFFRNVSRYHLGEDQMYANMIPGQISKSLREALGLSDNQLPLHVYRMRMFGYPPGWLEDARISRSGIALYADSKEIPTPGDEEGEIVNDGSKDMYDISKIHDFPGFNVSPEPATIDESEYHHCPPQSKEHSKEAMLKNIQKQSAADFSYKKLSSIPMLSSIRKDSADCENASLNSPDQENSLQGATTEDRCSPSLEDLEAQKQSLMTALSRKSSSAELSCSSTDMDAAAKKKQGTITAAHSHEDFKLNSNNASYVHLDQTAISLNSDYEDCEIVNEPVIGTSPRGSSNQQCTPKNQGSVRHVELDSSVSERVTPYSRTSTPQGTKIGTVKQIEQGTPILKSASPFSSLPSPDNFSKGICDVINFENLPDALGHYKRMNDVIHSVRNHLKRN